MASAEQQRYLKALGIEVFQLRGGEIDSPVALAETAALPERSVDRPGDVGDARAVGSLDWEQLAARVSACTLCELHSTRTQTVFGVGRRDAALMIVGEAPGADEDRQGEPFVGRAGRLLNAMLAAIGLGREEVFIANILKCRPPNNRDPASSETSCCTPYLERQLELVAPRAVLAVGRIAAQHLLQSDQAIGRLRGKALRFGTKSIPIVATYHPAYLLRTPSAKAKAWQDLVLVRRLITDSQ
jgi:DNA polymerase